MSKRKRPSRERVEEIRRFPRACPEANRPMVVGLSRQVEDLLSEIDHLRADLAKAKAEGAEAVREAREHLGWIHDDLVAAQSGGYGLSVEHFVDLAFGRVISAIDELPEDPPAPQEQADAETRSPPTPEEEP